MKELPEPHEGHLPARYQYVEMPPRNEAPAEPETGGLIEYWNILRRSKGTVLLFAVLGIIAAILFSLPQTPIYQAKASLEMLSINEDLLNTRQVDPNSGLQASDPQINIKTQISILQSSTLKDRVVAKLKTQYGSKKSDDGGRMAAWRKVLGLAPAAGGAKDQEKEKSSQGPDKNLSVRAVVGTRLVQLMYDSPDPKFAADYVNTLADEFIGQNVEVRYQTSQRTGDWLNRQLDDMKIRLERSEDQLQKYGTNAGLQFTNEKDSVDELKLKQVQEQLSTAQGERVGKQSKYEMAMTAPPESLPEILDDATLREYQGKITELRRQLAELSSTLTAEHYKVTRTQAQIAELEGAFNRQRANVISRIKNEYDAAMRRETLLLADYTAQSKFVTGQSEKAIHYNILKREVDTGRQLYDGMLQKVKEYGIASAMQASNVRVVDPAEAPRLPYKPNFPQNAGLGLLAGLFLGVGFVIIRERADRTIQGPGEVGLYVNAPELGLIPAASMETMKRHYYSSAKGLLHGDKKKGAGSLAENPQSVELVTFERKPSLIAESFRTVMASILFSGENGDHPRVIVMTSGAPKEGKTTITSNLALALAESHRRVLVIDADLRKPRMHTIFGVSNEHGLVDVLMAPTPLNGEAGPVCETIYPGVYVMPAGASERFVFNLLYSPRLPELVARFRKEFDVVLIDTPPMLNMSDARVLGRFADGVIVVMRAGRTTRDAVQASVQRLEEDGTKVLGTILNDWNPKRHTGYGYGYGYKSSYGGYYKHYGSEEKK